MPSQPEILVFAAGILGFWLAVHLLDRVASLEKYGVKVSLVFMKYESRRFKDFLCRISQKRQRAWKVFSNISVALGAGLLIFAVYFLSENLLEFVQPGGGGSPVVPVLPGLTIRVYWLPYFILAFLLAVITHEAAHGIVARVEGVNIKSAGLYLAVVQPGGFVEPDEKALERASTASKMRVLSAGSSMNLLVGLLVFLALSVLFFRVPSGIVVMEVLENGPLEQSGIGRWDVLFAVNGTRIKTGSDIDTFMADVTPGDQLTLSTSRGNFSIKAVSHPS
ncbi:MAG: site-2 protease family protein, partial [Candidatus Bathyarchaeota archaeon]|nr:site-2 protease family protein [Candidatus Bathyarchaeota archaeon]